LPLGSANLLIATADLVISGSHQEHLAYGFTLLFP